MAILLTSDSIPRINKILNEPNMLKLVGMGRSSLDITEEFKYLDCYESDDGLDIAMFERPDFRVAQGHNIFRSKGRVAINNGKDIIKTYFKNNPEVDLIFGLTPISNKTTIWFNRMIGFNFVKLQWLENGILAGRYEQYR